MEIKKLLVFDDESYDLDCSQFIKYLDSCDKINKKLLLNDPLQLMNLEIESLNSLDMNEVLVNQKVLQMGALLSRCLFTTDRFKIYEESGRYLYNQLYSLDNIYPLELNLYSSKCRYEFKLRVINLSNIQEDKCKVSSTLARLNLRITSNPFTAHLSDLIIFKFNTEDFIKTPSSSKEDKILFEFLMNYYELLKSEDK